MSLSVIPGSLRGVAGVRDQVELGLRPPPVQIPRAHHRADDVVAPLDDDAGDVADALAPSSSWSGCVKKPLLTK